MYLQLSDITTIQVPRYREWQPASHPDIWQIVHDVPSSEELIYRRNQFWL